MTCSLVYFCSIIFLPFAPNEFLRSLSEVNFKTAFLKPEREWSVTNSPAPVYIRKEIIGVYSASNTITNTKYCIKS